MKKKTLFLAILSICLMLLIVIRLDVSGVSADVLGTSVTVVDADKQIDIKNIKTERVARGGNISSTVNLNNLGEEKLKIDKVLVTVSKLDGTVELTGSIDVEKSLPPSRNSSFEIEFTGDLDEGEYIGLFQLYSNGKLLGDSKTVISISETVPEVLGAATEENNFIPLLLCGAFIVLVMASMILLFKHPSWLYKKTSIRIEDVFFLIAGLSAFGLGFCVGFFLTSRFPSLVS